jgi:acyl carrier protein
MTNETTAKELAELLKDCEIEGLSIPDKDITTVHLRDDLDIDSLDLINVLFRIEQKYGVKITGEDLEQSNLFSLGNLAAFVDQNK